MNAANLQVLYAGTDQILMSGGSQSSLVIDAPNATVTMTGGSPVFGAIIANTISLGGGGGGIYYDRHLQSSFVQAGNYMLSAFTWKKY